MLIDEISNDRLGIEIDVCRIVDENCYIKEMTALAQREQLKLVNLEKTMWAKCDMWKDKTFYGLCLGDKITNKGIKELIKRALGLPNIYFCLENLYLYNSGNYSMNMEYNAGFSNPRDKDYKLWQTHCKPKSVNYVFEIIRQCLTIIM